MLLDLPPPVSQHAYQQHMKVVTMEVQAEVEESMRRAREELRDHYDAPPNQTLYILISCDGTWQKQELVLRRAQGHGLGIQLDPQKCQLGSGAKDIFSVCLRAGVGPADKGGGMAATLYGSGWRGCMSKGA